MILTMLARRFLVSTTWLLRVATRPASIRPLTAVKITSTTTSSAVPPCARRCKLGGR